MTVGILALVAFSGGCGAALRYWLDNILGLKLVGALPWPTLIINVTGSFAIGMIAAASFFGQISSTLVFVLSTGLLGGYTTFSTASVQTDALMRARHFWLAAAYSFGALLACVAGAWIAFGISHLLWS